MGAEEVFFFFRQSTDDLEDEWLSEARDTEDTFLKPKRQL